MAELKDTIGAKVERVIEDRYFCDWLILDNGLAIGSGEQGTLTVSAIDEIPVGNSDEEAVSV